MAKKIHVLLLREWDQQMSSSGCCGRIEGDMTQFQGERVFPERRKVMEQMGEIYRTLYEVFPDEIEVEVVDPRNLIAYTTVVYREQKKLRSRLSEKVKQFVHGFHRSAIFVNGELLFSGEVPSPDKVVKTILQLSRSGG